MEYPFPPADVTVSIPKRFRAWFSEKESLTVSFLGETATVQSGSSLRLVPFQDGFAVLRGTVVVGEFDKHTVRRTLNDRLLRQVSVLRSAVYGVSFPAPLAYVLRDYSMVHPGRCFLRHTENVTLKALYSVKDEDARCCVCKEAFV